MHLLSPIAIIDNFLRNAKFNNTAVLDLTSNDLYSLILTNPCFNNATTISTSNKMMENFIIALPWRGLAHTVPALPMQVNAAPQTLVTQPMVVAQPAQPTVAPVATFTVPISDTANTGLIPVTQYTPVINEVKG